MILNRVLKFNVSAFGIKTSSAALIIQQQSNR